MLEILESNHEYIRNMLIMAPYFFIYVFQPKRSQTPQFKISPLCVIFQLKLPDHHILDVFNYYTRC